MDFVRSEVERDRPMFKRSSASRPGGRGQAGICVVVLEQGDCPL